MVENLSAIPFNSLNPILVATMKKKISDITPIELLTNYINKFDFFGPSQIDQRKALKFRSTFYDILPEKYDAIELAPISPIGTNSVITNISQDVSLSTIRASEVVSDPTTVLLLEAARRRKELMLKQDSFYDLVNLSTFHRVLRLQPFEKSSGFLQHFDLIGILSAGRKEGKNDLVIEVIGEHLDIWIQFVKHLKLIGYPISDIVIKISNIKIMESLIETMDLPRNDISKNTLNEEFDVFDKYNIDLPKEVESFNDINENLLDKYCLNRLFAKLVDFEKKIMETLKLKHKDVTFKLILDRKRGMGYYNGFCFHVDAKNHKGRNVGLVDGGSGEGLKLLLSDKKEQLITSGFGSELFQKFFEI